MGPALHSDNRALRFCEAGCPLAAGGRKIIPSRGARRFCPAEFGCRRHEQAPMAGRIWLPWGLARMMRSKAFIFYPAPAFTRRAFALFLFLLQWGLRHGRPVPYGVERPVRKGGVIRPARTQHLLRTRIGRLPGRAGQQDARSGHRLCPKLPAAHRRPFCRGNSAAYRSCALPVMLCLARHAVPGRGLQPGRPQAMAGTSLPAAIEISGFPPLRPFTQAARRTARRQMRPARRARCRPCGGPARACARAHTLLYSR